VLERGVADRETRRREKERERERDRQRDRKLHVGREALRQSDEQVPVGDAKARTKCR
jgi:hypothetical protein